jgi:AcrR family transcriptional regulator
MKRRHRVQRTQQRPGDARERILAAAQTLFAASGFDATSTKAIGAKAHVPAGLVFYYFPSKDALLDTLIKERSALAFVREAVERRLPAPASPSAPRAPSTPRGLQFLAALRERQEVVRILFRELHTHRRAALQFRQLREQAAGVIAAYLDQLLPARLRRTFSTADAARLFVSDLVLASTIDEPIDAEAFVAGAVHVLLDGRVPAARRPRLIP